MTDYQMSILSYEKRDRPCPGCGVKRILFVCHGFGLDWPRKIREYCKACALVAAGSEARIWVKTTFPKLRHVWGRDARPDKPAHLPVGRPRAKCPESATQPSSDASSATDDRVLVPLP
jgi:hypothetical protein